MATKIIQRPERVEQIRTWAAQVREAERPATIDQCLDCIAALLDELDGRKVARA